MIDVTPYIEKLPALNETAIKITSIINDPDSGINDIANVIKDDPVLCTEILRQANSPIYGFSAAITTVDRAVFMFGASQTRSIAILSSVKNDLMLDLSPYDASEQNFLDVSAKAYEIASKWRPRNELDILSQATFLGFLGKVIYSQALIAENKVSEFKERVSAVGEITAEREFFSKSALEASGVILEKYNMNANASSALKNIFSYDELPQGLAKRLALVVRSIMLPLRIGGQIDEVAFADATETLKTLDLDAQGYEAAFNIAK